MDNLPSKCVDKGIVFSFRISDNNVILRDKKALVISLLAEKDFPEPGVPRISPLGFFSFFLSTMIMLLERAFKP